MAKLKPNVKFKKGVTFKKAVFPQKKSKGSKYA